MSLLTLAGVDYRVKEFLDEQHDIIRTEERSPNIDYIEDWYTRNPGMYSPDKIENIPLSPRARAHVITHLDFKLGRMTEERKEEIAYMAERPFIRIPREPGTKIEPPRRTYTIERDKLGRLHARDKKSGRFRSVPKAFREVPRPS